MLITGKAILTESKLETVHNSTWLSTARNNSVYGNLCTYIYYAKIIMHIQIYLNGFINSALP